MRKLVYAVLTLSAGAAIPAGTVRAQEAPQVTTSTAPVEEVVVTGSRIAGQNLVATSPTTVVTVHDIQTAGKVDIDDIVLQLPQNFDNGLGQDLGNRTSGLSTPGGVATADLRGLGPNRTLVLVDGIRLGIGSPSTFIFSPAPDLDQIPTFLIERMDVVTGGASATYGSDAIAGVINFTLKRDFQGIQVDAQYGGDWHDNHSTFWQQQDHAAGITAPTGSTFDGRNQQFDVVFGAALDEGKGNVTGWISYFHTDPVTGAQRDWSSCQVTEIPRNPQGVPVTGASCGGSSNSNYFSPFGGSAYSVSGHDLVPFGSVPTNPPASFNSQPYIFMTRGDTRHVAGFRAHDDLSDWLKPYAQLYYTDDRTHMMVAPSALFRQLDPLTADGNYLVNCTNPLLSAQEVGFLCTPQAEAQAAAQGAPAGFTDVQIGRRNVEGGARISDYQHTSYRAVLGSQGRFADVWDYNAYGQYYNVNSYSSNQKYLNFQAIENALGYGTSNNLCTGTCVPYNIFQDGGVTPDQLNYLYLNGTEHGSYAMRTLHGEVTGQLGSYGLKLPTAGEGLAVNLGVEHRSERQIYAPDYAEQTGLMSGFGGAAIPLDASDSVTEEWLELRAPLVQDKPFAKDLSIDTAIRRSDYSVSGAVETHKFELQYAPTADIRFRGTVQTAIRAPSLIELYSPQNVGGISSLTGDPCAPTDQPAAATLAQCLRSVAPSQAAAFTAAYGNGGTTNLIPQFVSGQASALNGGNPGLQPEVARSWTAGFTFTPTFVPGLSGTVDYYHIKLTGGVTNPGAPQTLLNNCVLNGDASSCALIVRNQSTFALTGTSVAGGGYIVQTNINAAVLHVSGVDVGVNYKHDLPAGLGSVAFALNGVFELSNEEPLGQIQLECAGDYGLQCQTVNPRWRHILRMTWVTPWDATASLTWRYIGRVLNDNNDPSPALFGGAYLGGYDFFNNVIPAYNYLDIAATWKPVNNVELRAGINNLLDKDPPIITVGIAPGGANAYSAYDQLGRQVFVAATLKF
jgi:iron complex outermembrane recepter protein